MFSEAATRVKVPIEVLCGHSQLDAFAVLRRMMLDEAKDVTRLVAFDPRQEGHPGLQVLDLWAVGQAQGEEDSELRVEPVGVVGVTLVNDLGSVLGDVSRRDREHGGKRALPEPLGDIELVAIVTSAPCVSRRGCHDRGQSITPNTGALRMSQPSVWNETLERWIPRRKRTQGATGLTAPGPRELPIVGSLFDYRNDPLGRLLSWPRNFGSVVRFHLGASVVHLFSEPEHIKRVLQTHRRNYDKQTMGYRIMGIFLGSGLLTSDGDFWLRQRRIAQPAFHRARIAALAEAMLERTEAMLERWARRGAKRGELRLDIAHEMTRLTLEIVCETLFGQAFEGEVAKTAHAVEIFQRYLETAITRPTLPLSVPTPFNTRVREAQATLERSVGDIIKARRRMLAQGDSPHDLLTMLMEARDPETGDGMSDAQLRDEVLTLFVAGHETTSNALAWTFFLLSKHPCIARKLHGEIDAVLDGRRPAAEDTRVLIDTQCIVKESLRIYPPAWITARRAIDDDTVGGFHIPAKSLVFTSPYATHHRADLWPNPEGFDPRRFAPNHAPKRHKFAYFPFGGGPRLCIGRDFAMMEMVLVIATIAQHYHLDLVPGHRVELEPLITLRPKHGMHMRLRPR